MLGPIPATYHRLIALTRGRGGALLLTTAGIAAGTSAAAGADAAAAGRRPEVATSASTRAERYLVVTGAGSGHGVGLSQWGAYGYARHGFGYREILAHYYTATALGRVPGRTVRVLLAGNRDSISFTGADSAGSLRLDARATYSVTRSGAGALRLTGAPISVDGATPVSTSLVAAPLRVSGPGPSTLLGVAVNGLRDGHYRGALELRPGRHGGVNAVNVVALEDYVRGVVAEEVSPSWPAAALAAQAVAVRTYAITAPVGGGLGFDQYADTRSQLYGGLAAEHIATDRAVRATRDEVVTYGGRPVVTYYFDSSGGQTEDVEKGFPGAPFGAWLRSVADPFDAGAPLHRWGPLRIPLSRAAARLGPLVRGRLLGIEVLARGSSPRIVRAAVIGSAGRTTVTGNELATRLGLPDSWAYFALDPDPSRTGRPAPAPGRPPPGGGPAPPADGGSAQSGGASAQGDGPAAPGGGASAAQAGGAVGPGG